MHPPKKIPENLLSRFTLEGKIQVIDWYFDNSSVEYRKELYTIKNINKLIKLANHCITDMGEAFNSYYGLTDSYLYKALDQYKIDGLNLVHMGSVTPWYEAISLSRKCADCIVIEYGERDCEDDRIHYVTPENYDGRIFDTGFSISSFEHDGLGRYGDPVNPEGDLIAMKNMKNIIKKNGLLFLAIPIGLDKVVWNAHRIYGNIRLPMLFEGWKVISTIGFHQDMLKNDTGREGGRQPVFVLQNV